MAFGLGLTATQVLLREAEYPDCWPVRLAKRKSSAPRIFPRSRPGLQRIPYMSSRARRILCVQDASTKCASKWRAGFRGRRASAVARRYSGGRVLKLSGSRRCVRASHGRMIRTTKLPPGAVIAGGPVGARKQLSVSRRDRQCDAGDRSEKTWPGLQNTGGPAGLLSGDDVDGRQQPSRSRRQFGGYGSRYADDDIRKRRLRSKQTISVAAGSIRGDPRSACGSFRTRNEIDRLSGTGCGKP